MLRGRALARICRRIASGPVRLRLRSKNRRRRCPSGSRAMTAWVISWVSPAQTWSGFSYIQGLNHTVIALRTPSTGTIWYGSRSSWMRCCSRFQAQPDVIRPSSTGRPSLVRST